MAQDVAYDNAVYDQFPQEVVYDQYALTVAQDNYQIEVDDE